MKINKLLLCILSTALVFGTISCKNSSKASVYPKNIVFMIGDGMSFAQVYSTLLATKNTTSFERFPVTGLAKTYSASNKITDSAAGGTALATGVKTNNHLIGMDADSVPVPSILEICSDNGMKTGVVATCYLPHATPASFIAKNINRNNNYEIAADMATSTKINLMIGGGKKYFMGKKNGMNWIEEMKNDGWNIYDSLNQVDTTKDKIAVLAAKKHLPAYPERGDFLPNAVSVALQALENDNGFFLMVEGSQIDFAGHANDSAYLVNEMLDFNNTINVALDYAESHGNTLVIVTADHETGGLSLIDPNENYTQTNFNFSTKSHTPTFVPVFAYGPGAERFTGIMENTDIMKKILALKN